MVDESMFCQREWWLLVDWLADHCADPLPDAAKDAVMEAREEAARIRAIEKRKAQ
jgi:hypothetical protein